VSFGESGLDYCIILSASSTKLTCRVEQPKEPLAGVQQVYVYGRIQEKAQCLGTCEFTFSAEETPQIESISPIVARTGDIITISGNGFLENETEVIIGQMSITNLIFNGNGFTFEMPALELGKYDLTVFVNNKGNGNFANENILESELVMLSTSPTQGSKNGEIITIIGNGFKRDGLMVIIHTTVCEILQFTPNEITASCLKIKTNEESSVILKYKDEQNIDQDLTCDSCKYLPLRDRPIIKQMLTTAPYNLENVIIEFKGNHLKTFPSDDSLNYNIEDVRVWLQAAESIKFENYSVEGSVQFTENGVRCEFQNMTAGEYSIRYYIKGVGYSNVHSDIGSLILNPIVLDAPDIESSFTGGSVFTINGQGFPEIEKKNLISIKMCNLKCDVFESSFESIKCKSPMLNSPEIKDLLMTLSPEIQKDVVITGDKTNQDLNQIIDGNVTTFYQGINTAECWVQLDFGENMIIEATKIRLFPRPEVSLKNLVGGVLEVSLDGDSYDVLRTITEDIKENWNVFKPNLFRGEKWNFRFLRFRGGVKKCQISELEVTGISTS
jgi:uncharacterized protein (DUF2141 family)